MFTEVHENEVIRGEGNQHKHNPTEGKHDHGLQRGIDLPATITPAVFHGKRTRLASKKQDLASIRMLAVRYMWVPESRS